MPKVRIVEFEGTEAEILTFLKAGGGSGVGGSTPAVSSPATSHHWDSVARKFAKHVVDTASWGKPAQKQAMDAWLGHDGEIELTRLWNAAGVKTQHDYAGVGGSLTKNMVKAGGPRDWYVWKKNQRGQWIYTIIPELVPPLKTAFGIS